MKETKLQIALAVSTLDQLNDFVPFVLFLKKKKTQHIERNNYEMTEWDILLWT